VIWGIVGSEAAKFTPEAEASARYKIVGLLRPGDVVVSGCCPRGGVDDWAEEIALELRLPFVGYRPLTHDWEGFKARNIQIAEAYEQGVCITPRELALDYRGRRVKGCYHCRRDDQPDDHVVSGGCWTLQYGRRLGKPGRVIIV